jgi:hypothetical protein
MSRSRRKAVARTYDGQQNAAVSPGNILLNTSLPSMLSVMSALTTVAVVQPEGHTSPGE